MVGASISLPQLRQNASPGAATVPHWEQTGAFHVGSFMMKFPSIVLLSKLKTDKYFLVGNLLWRRCFYR